MSAQDLSEESTRKQLSDDELILSLIEADQDDIVFFWGVKEISKN